MGHPYDGIVDGLNQYLGPSLRVGFHFEEIVDGKVLDEEPGLEIPSEEIPSVKSIASAGRTFLSVGDPFKMTVFFANGSATASDMEAFFSIMCAMQEDPRPAELALFISSDESTFGRCSSVSSRGGVIAMTVVDTRVDEEAYYQIKYVVDEMSRVARYSGHLRKNMQGDCRTRCAIQCALDDGAALVVDRLRYILMDTVASWTWSYDDDDDDRQSVCAQSRGKLPDIASLLTHVRGPIHRKDIGLDIDIDNSDHLASIATVFGGDVAVVCMDNPDYAHDLMSIMPELQMARIRFGVYQNYNHRRGLVASASLGEHPSSNPYLVVDIYGVPAAHVAYVMDEAVSLALECLQSIMQTGRMTSRHHERITDLLTRPCSREIRNRALAARVSNAHLSHEISRFVDANLETIKQKLWAPGAPLCQRFMESEMNMS